MSPKAGTKSDCVVYKNLRRIDDSVLFGLAYLAIVTVHTVLFARASSATVVQAVFQLAPLNLLSAGLILAAGIAGGTAEYVLWTLAFGFEWITPSLIRLGDFEIVLAGTSAVGQPQDITLVGKVTAGTANPDGSVSFSGTAALDMGDGSLPVSVPFAAVVTTGGLQLTIGTTVLPTQTLGAGDIFIG